MKKIIFIYVLLTGFIVFAQNSKFKTYRVSSHETITSIAQKLGVTPYDLLKLNPDAKDGISVDEVLIVPNKSFKIAKSIIQQQRIKKDSIVDGFLYHTVKPLETVYSLSTKYKISKRKVRKLNNLNRKGDISVGQVLKFPTDLKDTKQEDTTKVIKSTNNNTFLYTVKPNDTYYKLTRVYQVSEDKLKQLNPILKDGLKSGIQINIPKLNDQEIIKISQPLVEKEPVIENEQTNSSIDSIAAVQVPQYIIHKVQAKEGFFRLKQLYGLSKEEILEANPQIIDGLKLGMEIRIPKKQSENLFIEGQFTGKVLNVVIMLPFKSDVAIDLEEKSKKAIKLHKITDFYFGTLMALDSLKQKGLSVNVKVFDTKNSDFVVNKILNNYDFDKTNIVIAPLKFKHFTAISKMLAPKNIVIISPLSPKDCSVIGVKSIVQQTPPDVVLENTMLNYISSNYKNQNIVIITDEKKPNTNNDFNADVIKNKLLKNDSIKSIHILRMKDNYIERELFEEYIDEKKENWVILASKKEITTYIAVENLAVFSDDYHITLFSLTKPEKLRVRERIYLMNDDNEGEETYKIKSEYLNKLHFQFPSITYKDENNSKIIKFNEAYTNKFGNVPTSLSYKGFDTLYDSLIRFASYQDPKDAFNINTSYRLTTKFSFKKNINESFTNFGVYLLRYNDFNLEIVY